MRFKEPPPRRKLLLGTALAIGLALLLSLVVQIVASVRTGQAGMQSRLTAIVDVLAIQGKAALRSGDPAAAADLLASLRTQPEVARAMLRRADGSVFAVAPADATDSTPAGPAPATPRAIGRLQDGWMVIEHPLHHDGRLLGSLRLDADLAPLRQALLRDAARALTAALAAFGIAMLLAARLLGAITFPLRAVATAPRDAVPAAAPLEPATLQAPTPVPELPQAPVVPQRPAVPAAGGTPPAPGPAGQHPIGSLRDVSTGPVAHRATRTAVEDHRQPPAAAVQQRNMPLNARVLLAEDNQVNREIATAMLHAIGCKVVQAHDGAQALAAVLTRDIDLVLMDCQMPVMDGFESTRQIRAWEKDQPGRVHLPIVALTANALAGDREACLSAGMDDYLVKPVSSSRLTDTLARHLSMPGWPAPAGAEASAQAEWAAITTPVVHDPAVLASLPMVADGSHPHFVQDMQRLFVDSSLRTLAEIDAAMAGADGALLLRLLHSMKSASAQVGAMELSALARDFEHALRAGRPPAPHWPHLLRQAFGRVQAAWPAASPAAENQG